MLRSLAAPDLQQTFSNFGRWLVCAHSAEQLTRTLICQPKAVPCVWPQLDGEGYSWRAVDFSRENPLLEVRPSLRIYSNPIGLQFSRVSFCEGFLPSSDSLKIE